MRALLLLAALVALGACATDDAPNDDSISTFVDVDLDSADGDIEAPVRDDLQPAPSGLQAPVPDTDAGDLAPPLVGTLVDARPGDRACTLTLADDVGTEAVVLAALDLCEPPDLVGQRVRLAYEEAMVMAESCGGDAACPDTDTVLLAVAMEPEP